MSTARYGFFYMNGMMADEASAKQVEERIRSIIQEKPRLQNGRSYIAIHSNDASPTDRVIGDVVMGVLGAFCIGYATRQEKKDALAVSAFGVGVVALGSAFHDYKEMQDDKNEIASSLVNRVKKFLEEDHLRVATLILHSQGADVGFRALQQLEGTPFPHRINVITLGAMTTIPKGMCANVKNFKFTNDKISRIVASPFEAVRCANDGRRRETIDLENKGFNTHGAIEYLENRFVCRAIRELGATSGHTNVY